MSIDPDILEAMQDRARKTPRGQGTPMDPDTASTPRRVEALAPAPMDAPYGDADLIRKLRERSGAAYAAGDDARAQRLRRAAEILQEE